MAGREGGEGKKAYKVYPAVIKQSAFQKQPFDMWNTPKQNGINVLNATVFLFVRSVTIPYIHTN